MKDAIIIGLAVVVVVLGAIALGYRDQAEFYIEATDYFIGQVEKCQEGK